MAEISDVLLRSGSDGTTVKAELWDCITDEHIDDWKKHWKPAMDDFRANLDTKNVPPSERPQHLHWDWEGKAGRSKKTTGTPGFCIVHDGIAQGMMIVDESLHMAREDSQKGKSIVYIDYLENAPWNQAIINNGEQRFKGIGLIMIRAAVALSYELGFKGRIGLHSLDHAAGFYDYCKMTNLGRDNQYYNLHYFEMTEIQAVNFY